MESLLVAIAPELVALLGAVITGLITWGIVLLRQRVKSEIGLNALDTVNSIISAVVGNLTQTAAKEMREASKDGRLSKDEKRKLKLNAIEEASRLISNEVAKAASGAVDSLDGYLSRRIEAQVLASKK